MEAGREGRFKTDLEDAAGKESTYNVGNPGSIPGSGSSPGEGIGYPLQYSWVSRVTQMVKNLLAMWFDFGLGRYPGGGHGKPLQYSYLENPMDRGAGWAIAYGVAKSWAQLSG